MAANTFVYSSVRLVLYLNQGWRSSTWREETTSLVLEDESALQVGEFNANRGNEMQC